MADLRETAVEYVAGAGHLLWYTSEPKYMKRLHALAEETDEVVIVNDDGESMLCRCPASWFKPPKPPTRRNLTAEQRQQAAERLKKARNSDK